jgi:transcriptional regulator of acetoin/glycerol metabolism
MADMRSRIQLLEAMSANYQNLLGFVRTASAIPDRSANMAALVENLEVCNWVVGGEFGAAARLGVKRTTLMDKMRRRGPSQEIFQSRGSDLHCIPGAVLAIDGSAAV